MITYAGIGSRETPVPICNFMRRLGFSFAEKRYCLRSGNAAGADEAFIRGALDFENPRLEVYLPWKGFGKIQDERFIYEIPDKAFTIAEEFHPTYHSLSSGVKKMMARNAMQVLGSDLNSPSNMIICYTHDGKDSGGTGQAIRMARHFEVPVYNLSIKEDFQTCKGFLDGLTNGKKGNPVPG